MTLILKAAAVLAALATPAFPAPAAPERQAISAPAGHDDPAEFAPAPRRRTEVTSAPTGHDDPADMAPPRVRLFPASAESAPR